MKNPMLLLVEDIQHWHFSLPLTLLGFASTFFTHVETAKEWTIDCLNHVQKRKDHPVKLSWHYGLSLSDAFYTRCFMSEIWNLSASHMLYFGISFYFAASFLKKGRMWSAFLNDACPYILIKKWAVCAFDQWLILMTH